MKFDAKRGLAGVKREGKKLPKKVMKQMPAAAATLAGGGLAIGGGRLLAATAGKMGAKKAAKRGATIGAKRAAARAKRKTTNLNTDKMNSYWKSQERYRREGIRRAAKNK